MYFTIQRRFFPSFLIILAPAGLHADSSKAPALDWVKTLGGSGASSVSAVAADTQGNLYIAGSTTSLDLLTVAAAQPHAGGSPLIRIDPTAATVQNLYSPDLTAIANIAVDARNPATIYAVSPASLLRSTDAGNTWKILPGLPSGTNLNAVAVDPTNSSVIYLGTTPLGAFKSTDGGATWAAINNGIPPIPEQTLTGAIIQSLDVALIWIDPKSPNSLFALSGSFALFRSGDGGRSWSVSPVPGFVYGSLAFDPFTKGTLYAGGPGYYIKSTDEGQNWIPFAAQLTEPVTIAPDPFHPGVLYAGNYSALYRSTDSGQTWTQEINSETALIVADPNKAVMYANLLGIGIVQSTDGFKTYSQIGPQSNQVLQILVAGSLVFELSAPTTDVFVTKLDNNGNIVFSTYFGGTGTDSAFGLALGTDGSVYVTGQTDSADFPVTKGAYLTTFPIISSLGPPQTASFVFKLNPNGSLAWSTYFTNFNSSPGAIAVDSAGNPYVGGGTSGGLPVTPGAYETQFSPVGCGPGNIGPCFIPTSAFLTKFNSQGSALIFSTYISQDRQNNLIENVNAIALAPNGNIYLADNGLESLSGGSVYSMNATGSALLQSNASQPIAVDSIALDSAGNLYATGTALAHFVATPGAFQSSPQPAIPALPGVNGNGPNAFVLKFDSTLSKVLAATLLGGEGSDAGQSIAIDASGNVIVGGYTSSKAFPLGAPFQASFSDSSGFVAGFDSSLSHLLFSTYLGDIRPFTVQGAIPDGHGNLLLAGATQIKNSGLISDLANFFPVPNAVIANKIALSPAPAVQLDSVVNYASQLGVPLSPGEAIAATGSGFGPDAKLVLDGQPLPVVSASANTIVSVIPNNAQTSGAVRVTVSNNGITSNPVYLPAAAASPGIYSVDGLGVGQGYILNADGTPNSQSNPAAPGSPITIFATGVGPFSLAGTFAVTDQPVAVFVDGFYSNGIAAVMKPVPGLPGDVYQIGVYIPNPASLVSQNPDLMGFILPPEVSVTMSVGAARSQNGIALWVKQN
ncbi:MAG: SBBP repeat-containing protein [Bryobacteraceae bacterium]|jgi:uncharacterized protein (TIGR03437 family)